MAKKNDYNGLQPGDIVMLKSGGPAMTVSRLVKETLVVVVWFDAGIPVVHPDTNACVTMWAAGLPQHCEIQASVLRKV